MRAKVLSRLAAGLFVSVIHAQEPHTERIEVFEGSASLSLAAPLFPSGPEYRGEEGWVIVNFMVDEQGKAFEPSVVDSMGDRAFEAAALNALAESTFKPATISGNPIVGSSTLRYRFVLENGENAARVGFVFRYRRLLRFINADDREKAEAELERMEEDGARSLYEDAFLNLAKYYYAARYGSSEEQMTYLRRALFFYNEDTYETYLPAEDALKFWPQLFVLQASNYRLAEALATYEVIAAVGDEATIDSLAEAVEALRKAATDETSYAIAARTDENGTWGVALFKDEFYLRNAESNIEEIKLRCDRRYVFFEFDPETQYKVPSQFGQCHLEIVGNAGASFELVQF